MKTPRAKNSLRYPRAPRLKINISKAIFEQAKRADSSHCMIAEAIKASAPYAKSISVDLQTIRFSDPERRLRYVYLTPRIAQIGVIEFDQGHDIEPFDFTLTGAHVIAMASKVKAVEGLIADPVTGAMKETRVLMKASRVEKMNLAKQGIRAARGKGEVPERVGGRPPPSVPFSRRRAFGLRAIQK